MYFYGASGQISFYWLFLILHVVDKEAEAKWPARCHTASWWPNDTVNPGPGLQMVSRGLYRPVALSVDSECLGSKTLTLYLVCT